MRESLLPCHCPSCWGKLRNKRTVRRHFSSVHPSPQRIEIPISEPLSVGRTCTSLNGTENLECHLDDLETFHVSGQYIESAPRENSLFAINRGGIGDISSDSHDDLEDENENESDGTWH